MQQPIVFVHKEVGSELFRITITGTKEAPGPIFRSLNRKNAVKVISEKLQDGITNISDTYGLLDEAYRHATGYLVHDGECFFCGNEWEHVVDLGEGYQNAYPHGRVPLCSACKEMMANHSVKAGRQ